MINALTDLLFPAVCEGCKSFLLGTENVICTHCRHAIPVTNHHSKLENEAFMKFYGKVPIEFASTLFYFHKKGMVQELIHNMKYRGKEEIGAAIGAWQAADLKDLPVIKTVDIIIPVPLHKKRLKQRGYNQVTAYGLALSAALNIKYDASLLKRTIYSKSQVNKNVFGRSTITENIFEASFNEADHNKHFLLVDDVLTTGATLEACSNALLKIPGAKISIVCMAMTQS